MRRTAVLLLTLTASVVSGTSPSLALERAQSETGDAGRTRLDLSKLGPQVGERVPDFSLQDQAGKTWTRQSIMGQNGAMLVFYRSADW